MPTWVFEAVVAPLAAALAFGHARRALGARRAAGEMAALAAYGFALEAVAMAVFASHEYDPSWRVAPLGVPLAVAAVWAAIITSATAVAGRRERSRGWRAATAALGAIALDLMIEPVATRASLWRWTPPGPWLGVPIGNFVGWAVIVGAYAWGAERWPAVGGVLAAITRRAALATACILALVAVGLVWTALDLERAFEGSGGWAVWAGVLAALSWRVWAGAKRQGWAPALPGDGEAGTRAAGGGRWGVWGGARRIARAAPTFPPSSIGQPDSSLPARLAGTPGRGPEASLGIVAIAFAVEAVRIGETGVMVAAVGSLAAIAALCRRPDGTVS